MADNVTLNAMSGGDVAAADDIGGVKYQRVKISVGVDGSATDVSTSAPMPISDAGGSVTVDGAVSITGTVPVDGSGVTQPVSGPLTDAQLRAVAVPISGTVTANVGTGTQPVSGTVAISGTVPVSGPLTDTQLRATAVPVSGTVTANAGTGTMAVSAASLPLPTGAATSAKQAALGTAGSPSTDVLTVQGNAAGTPIPVSGSMSLSQTFKTGAYGTKTDVLTTELNSLANNGNTALSAAYDNATNRYPQADIRLTLATQGSARSAGATIAVYMSTRLDGSTFDDGNETTAELVAVFPLDAATTARVATRRRITLPPEQVEFFARNLTGQALAASGNVVSVRPYYTTAV